MRKLTSILLLALLCCALLGYHLVFHFQLSAVKSEMKAFLLIKENHKDVFQIILSTKETSQLHWEDENEFRYQGKMYDVLEKKCKDNQILFRCIADEKETALLHEYQKNNKQSSSNSIVLQLITAQFVLPSDNSLKRPERIFRRNFIHYSSSLYNLASPLFLQPPDAC